MAITNVKTYPNTPYYDDYDETKGFYRILFRPGYSVQARELTQMQTALQAQLDRLGQYAFKDGDAVIGGQLNREFTLDYIKLEEGFTTGGTSYTTSNYLSEFAGTVIRGVDNGGNRVEAEVLDVLAIDGSDPNTLYIKYTSKGGANNDVTTFAAGEVIESYINSDGTALSGVNRLAMVGGGADIDGIGTASSIANQTGFGSRVTLNEGVFFVAGCMVHTPAQSLILDKYTNSPTYSVYLTVSDEIVTSATDSTLFDNATGTPNASAPGANRYSIILALAKDNYTVDLANDVTDNRILLKKYKKGVQKTDTTNEPERNQSRLTERLAQRTYEESGSYAINPYMIQVREDLNTGDGEGKYTSGEGGDRNKIHLNIEPNVAYVKGFRVENDAGTELRISKPRNNSDTFNVEEENLPADVGNYVLVQTATLEGSPDITSYSTVNLKDATNGTGNTIGTARIREIEYGATVTQVYLFDITMNTNKSFSLVKSMAGGTVTYFNLCDEDGVLLVGSSARRLEGGRKNSLVFKLPYSCVKSTKQATKTVGGPVIQPTAANEVSYDVRLQNTNVTVTGGAASVGITQGVLNGTTDVLVTTNDDPTLRPANVTSGNGTATFGINGLGGAATATVYYTARRSGANSLIRSKTETNHTLNFNTQSGTGWTEFLAHADIIRINSITDANGNDYKDSFTLDDGRRNNQYAIGSITHTGREIDTANVLVLTIDYDYYSHGAGDFFAVDSYYEASNASTEAQALQYEAIPSFSGYDRTVNLRDAIDFRPTALAGGGFAGNAMVRVNSLITSDVTFYMPRIDKVYVSADTGEIAHKPGTPGINPKPPKDPDNSMVVFKLGLPGYVYDAQQIRVIPIDNKRFTMRDIGKLEKRIQRLEYYTSLSLIEKQAESTQIFDENSVERLKNGFIVDGFYGHNVANTAHPDHNCAMDRKKGVLRPKFTESSVNLIRNAADSGKVVTNRSIATLPYGVSPYIVQPYASESEFINPYNVFSWDGTLQLSPDTDEWKEVDVLPDVVINDEAMYDQFIASAESAGILGTVWNEWETHWSGTEEEVTEETSSETSTNDDGNSTTVTTTNTTTTTTTATTTEEQTRTALTTSVTSTTQTQSLGPRVVETNFIPFIRSRKIYFKGELLKPNTKFYAFFDGVNVTNYCSTQGGFQNWSSTTNQNYDYSEATQSDGTNPGVLVSDASGKVEGSFIIPRNSALKFRTGQRTFKLTDSATDSATDATSTTSAKYFAQGLIETVENVYLNIKVPQIRTEETTESRTIETSTTNQSTSTSSNSTTEPNPTPEVEAETDPIENTDTTDPQESEAETGGSTDQTDPQNPVEVEPTVNPTFPDIDIDWTFEDLQRDLMFVWSDPLAQTFMVDHAGGAFFSSIDLFFEDKDPNIPVNVSIRQVANGYPTTRIIPGSSVNVYPADIRTSTDGSARTRIKFDFPIYVPSGVEAAICLISMSDKPKLFVSTVGNFDLANPSQRIDKQPYNGVFFKSANASTWTAEQDRDLKFTLNRCVFSTTPKSIEFINEAPPTKRLGFNPLLFVANPNGTDCDIRVFHRDHGMHTVGDRVTLSGATGTINGIPAANINGTHVVTEQELDSYTIRVTGQATNFRVLGGGANIRATTQTQYSVANVVASELKLPATDITYTLSTLSGKSIDNTSETAYAVDNLFTDVPVEVNRNITFTQMRSVPNTLNTSQQGITLKATMTNNGDNFLSPVIDIDRMSVVTVNNRINNPTDAEYNVASAGRQFIAETEPVRTSALSSYVTKRVVLNDEAEVLNAYLSVNRPTGSEIKLYYKVSDVGSDTAFNDLNWIEATPNSLIPIDNSGRYTEVEYSITPTAPGDPNVPRTFGSFAFKIVFTSTTARKVPSCKDFRAIAAT